MKVKLVSLLASATLLLSLIACGGSGNSDDNDSFFETSGYKACDSQSLMTTSPIPLSDLIAIRPLGTLNPPDHTQPTRHTYWYAADQGNPPPAEELADVVSPGDIRIFEISETTYSNSSRPYEKDYTMHFFICNNVSGYFNHVQTLDSQFAQLIGDFSQGNCSSYSTSSETVTNCTLQVEVDIPVGMRIGSVSYYGTLDFGMDDSRVQNTMANPDRFSFIEHAVCPMDFFINETKQALLGVTGEYDGSVQRTLEPRCGKVDFDIIGTASGAWVLDPLNPDLFLESVSIALAKDNINPTLSAISVGNIGSNVDQQVIRFSPESQGLINRPFEDIPVDGQIYCYNNGSTSVIIQLIDQNHLRFDTTSSECNGQESFSSNAINLQR